MNSLETEIFPKTFLITPHFYSEQKHLQLKKEGKEKKNSTACSSETICYDSLREQSFLLLLGLYRLPVT